LSVRFGRKIWAEVFDIYDIPRLPAEPTIGRADGILGRFTRWSSALVHLFPVGRRDRTKRNGPNAGLGRRDRFT